MILLSIETSIFKPVPHFLLSLSKYIFLKEACVEYAQYFQYIDYIEHIENMLSLAVLSCP